MIIIPDVHGREFWKDPVNQALKTNEKIIFLGDYLDVYPHEHILKKTALENFKQIIELKKQHDNQIILLLGNHDCGYIWPKVCDCRKDYLNLEDIKKTFKENINLFKLAYKIDSKDITYLFSHAGVHDIWLEKYNLSINDLLNMDLNQDLTDILRDVSYYRGGIGVVGSCVWADIYEWVKYSGPEYQIFGHSQLEQDPIITDWWACLDCRKAFKFDDETNKILEI